MLRKLLIGPVLAVTGIVFMSPGASAMPLANQSASQPDHASMIQKVWHSGMPHRKIVGDRVYGGNCPPQGCPAWTQRDLAQDRRTGEWYSPQNEQRQRREYNRRAPRGYGYGYDYDNY